MRSDALLPTTAKESRAARQRRMRKMRLGEVADWKCAYCGCQIWPHTITLDHIIPRCRAGSRIADNSLPSCLPCNQRKGNGRTMTFWPSPEAVYAR